MITATAQERADAVADTAGLMESFTCDEQEQRDLLRYASREARCPLARCACGRVVLVAPVPEIIEVVQDADAGEWTDFGFRCLPCAAGESRSAA